MSTIINGTSSAITFPDTTVQNTAFTTGAVTQSTIGTNVAGTGPAFSAYQSSSQTLSGNTWTKVTLDTEEFDTNNNFASSRFTPTVAGYYQVNGRVEVTTAFTPILISIYKNGSLYKALTNPNNSNVSASSGGCLVYLNGSTDYIELYSLIVTGQTLVARIDATWFNGAMVRAA